MTKAAFEYSIGPQRVTKRGFCAFDFSHVPTFRAAHHFAAPHVASILV